MDRRMALTVLSGVFAITLLATFQLAVSSQDNNPGNASAAMLLRQGMQLQQAGDQGGAVRYFKECLSLDPQNKYAHHYLALAYAETGNYDEAIMEFKNALNADYNYVECHNNYAMVLEKAGKQEPALQEFRNCVRINPRYPYAYYHIGLILKQRGELDSAVEAFQTAVDIKPDYADAQKELGLAMFERAQQGDLSNAVDKLMVAAKLVPNNPVIHYDLGKIYAGDGKLDEAEAEFRRSLMLDPQLAAGHWELAKLRYYRGDIDRPLFEVQDAEKVNPTYTEAKKYPRVEPAALKYLTAKCFELRGKLALAVDNWKEYCQLVRDRESTLQHVAELEKELRRGVRKKQKAGVPVADPEEIEALISKGMNQYDDGDLQGAGASFQRAAELDPTSFEALQNLGACAEAAGDLNAATAKYQAAMALLPSFDGAVYNMAYMLEKMNLPADAGLMYQKFHEMAGKYPYDPKHIVALQQEDARVRARAEQVKRRGY